MIFVTTGTQGPFPRLIDMINKIRPLIDEEIIIQDGEVWTNEKYISIFQEARVIVSHAGIGTLVTAVHQKKPLIVIPRLSHKGEKSNDHQIHTTEIIKEYNMAYIANSETELLNLLRENLIVKPISMRGSLCSRINELITGKTLVAVCSNGGHSVELKEIVSNHNCIWVTTGGNADYQIPNTSRKSILRLFSTIHKLYEIFKKENPQIVISTGAAPGFFAIMLAKIMGIQTIWVDSLACVKFISLSGRLALPFTDFFYTQWIENAKGRIMYCGSIIQ